MTRTYLKIPIMGDIDMSSSCVCCNKAVCIGFACSYCLSLYCENKIDKIK